MSAALRAALASVDQELGYLTTRVEHLRSARTSLAALLGDEAQETLAEPVASAGKGQDATEVAAPNAPPASADPSPTPPRRVSRGVGAADGAKPRRLPRKEKAERPGTLARPGTKLERLLALIGECGANGVTRSALTKLVASWMGDRHLGAEMANLKKVGRVRETEVDGHRRVYLAGAGGSGRGIPEVVPVPPSTPPSPPVPRLAPAAPKPADDAPRRTIKVDGITTREDRFKCLPFACTLTAGACVDRQGFASANTKGPSTNASNDARRMANAYSRCANCAQGREVAKRLGGAS